MQSELNLKKRRLTHQDAKLFVQNKLTLLILLVLWFYQASTTNITDFILTSYD